MVAQHPPFTAAQPSDPFYRCLAGKRGDIFWRTHCKNKEGGEAFFSEEFKDLMESMLKLEPSHRATIQDVLEHPWMKGEVPALEKVIAEFSRRDIVVKEQMESDRQAKSLEKAKALDARKKVMRSGGVEIEDDIKMENLAPSKKIDCYEKLFATNTEFFSTYNPDMIQEAICNHLQKIGIQFKVNADKYKVKFTMVSKD